MNNEDLVKWLKSPDGEKAIKNIVLDSFKKKEKIKKFITTKNFKLILEKIKQYLKEKENFIVNNEYKVVLFNGVKNNDFIKVVETIFENSKKIKSDKNYMFPNSYCYYQDMRFEMIFGQGTAFRCFIEEKKNVKIK
jgi:hypothetical protein